MAQKSRRNGGMSSFARKHVGDMVPQPDNVSAATLTSMDRLTILMEKAMREILVVTYWFDPVPHSGSYPVTVRFSGRRTDVKGRLSSGDRFVQDEIIKEVFPGSGPISLTARIYNINPGTWVVAAHQLQSISSIRASKEQGKVAPVVGSLPPIVRLWYRWAPDVSSVESTNTCLIPFAHVPGILPGVWGAMVAFGLVVALTLQFLLISGEHLKVGSWWVVSLGAIISALLGRRYGISFCTAVSA